MWNVAEFHIPIPIPEFWNLEFEMPSSECPTSHHAKVHWNVECGMWNVECGMWISTSKIPISKILEWELE